MIRIHCRNNENSPHDTIITLTYELSPDTLNNSINISIEEKKKNKIFKHSGFIQNITLVIKQKTEIISINAKKNVSTNEP